MTLRQAIETGMPFRQHGEKKWMTVDWLPGKGWICVHHNIAHFTTNEILADNWEIKATKPDVDNDPIINTMKSLVNDAIY